MTVLRLRFIVVALCLLLLPPVLFSQAGVASLSGLVADPSGAILVGAQVTETNVDTLVARSTVTDHSGYYTFVGLPVGHYRVTVAQGGFQSEETMLVLDPSEQARQDFHLAVAGINTQVEISEASTELSRDDASIGTVIDHETIVGTPLYQRNWDDLIRLVPGVQMQRFTQQSGSSTSGSTGLFVIHGIGNEQNDYVLDGVDNNTFSENLQELSASAARPSVDVISEFKLISNAYTALYGRSPGAQVDVSTRGGTNSYHGLLFEYLRNKIFDSNDYFTHQEGMPKPQLNQNQFGGYFGAPIIKDKLFGFFDYEGTRIAQGVNRISTVPLANERAGVFTTAAAAAAGVPNVTYATLYNPATGKPFPNNTIPSVAFDPFGAKILNAFPLPNLPGDFNNYARTAPVIDNTDSYDARVDWTPTAKDQLFIRYTGSNRIRDVGGDFGGIADGSSTSSWGNSVLNSWSVALGWTRTISPTLTNDFRLGFVRNFSQDKQQPFGLNSPDAYIPGVPDNPATAGGIGITEYVSDNDATIGSPAFLPKQQVPQQFQYTDTVSWNKGRHFLRFGGDLRAPMRNIYQDEDYMNGGLAFAGIFSAESATPGNGASYADGLLGLVYEGALSNTFFVDQRLWMVSGFAQDDWKVSPKLTLNLGLRYDFATPPYSAKNQLANFNPAGSGSLLFASDGSLGNRSLVQINNHDFAPRFGFAYSPNDKTVIRGGYGLYYLLFKRAGSEDQLALNPPNLLENTVYPNLTKFQPAFLLQQGFPANTLSTTNINYSQLHIHAMQQDSPTPSSGEWSLGFQRQLPGKVVLTTDYVGTKSTHLDVIQDLNQFVPGTTTTPYPNFGYLEYSRANGVGNYSGLEVSAQRRFTDGLSLEAAYTWSKNTGTTYEQTYTNALSGSDVPQRFVLSYLYELPFGHGKQFLQHGTGSAILGGWRTSGIYTYSSGLPFTVTSGGNLSDLIDANGNATSLPNLIGTPKIVGKPNCWFYTPTAACEALSPGTAPAWSLPSNANPYGDGGVNTLRGPHTNVFDFALMRDFKVYRETNLQFRWEVFNLTNSVLFAQPDSALSDSGVGVISNLAGDPRFMQFALRFSF
jgi:Carboxypeptidase regulatory-like domain/TonB dependent receptor/TonB-dependent Receptor Plug Domain